MRKVTAAALVAVLGVLLTLAAFYVADFMRGPVDPADFGRRAAGPIAGVVFWAWMRPGLFLEPIERLLRTVRLRS
jgi:hypothetical protein